MYYDDIYRRLEMRDIGTAFCGNEHIFQRVLLQLFLSKKKSRCFQRGEKRGYVKQKDKVNKGTKMKNIYGGLMCSDLVALKRI